MIYILFFVGLFILVKGADWLVDGASDIARQFNIPDLVIGLTIVAIGTSAPELVVNLMASFSGETDLAFGNVLGSNVANVLLILGVSALIFPLTIPRTTFKSELPFSLVILIITGILGYNFRPWGEPGALGRTDGWILLGLFLLFWLYTISLTRKHRRESEEQPTSNKKEGLAKSGFLILIGVLGLFFGGQWVVNGAMALARFFSVSEGLIAVTLVAVGTSLPELTTSIAAARKKNSHMAVGNAVGSNIFNLLWVLGLSSVVHPIPYLSTYNFDIGANLLAGLSLILLVVLSPSKTMKWSGGILFLVLYTAYIGFSISLKGTPPI